MGHNALSGINIYLITMGTLAIITLLWLYRNINYSQTNRRKHLKKIESFDAVETDSPLEDHENTARKKGLASVETRFTIIKRALLPAVAAVFLLLLAIPFLGNLPSTIITLLAASTTVVLGITARPFIGNLICGIVITFSRLIRIGDTVLIDGNYGTVEDISLTHTTLKIWDWRRYVIPNAKMLDKEFINYTVVDSYRWVKVEFWASYDADLDLVEKIAIEAMMASENLAEHEPPRLWVNELTKEGAHCLAMGWADSPSQGWMLAVDVRRELIKQFQKHGIKSHFYRYAPTSIDESK